MLEEWFYFLMSLKLEINYAQRHLVHFLMSLTQIKGTMLTNLFHFLMSLTQKKNYARKPASTQHDIQRLVGFPHFIKASGLAPL